MRDVLLKKFLITLILFLSFVASSIVGVTIFYNAQKGANLTAFELSAANTGSDYTYTYRFDYRCYQGPISKYEDLKETYTDQDYTRTFDSPYSHEFSLALTTSSFTGGVLKKGTYIPSSSIKFEVKGAAKLPNASFELKNSAGIVASYSGNTISIENLSDGRYDLTFQGLHGYTKDNVSYYFILEITTYFYIDTTPPAITIDGKTPSSDETLYINSSSFTVKASDTGVGLLYLYYKTPNSTKYEVSLYGDYITINETFGKGTYSFYAEDKLYNRTAIYTVSYGMGYQYTRSIYFEYQYTREVDGVSEYLDKKGSTDTNVTKELIYGIGLFSSDIKNSFSLQISTPNNIGSGALSKGAIIKSSAISITLSSSMKVDGKSDKDSWEKCSIEGTAISSTSNRLTTSLSDGKYNFVYESYNAYVGGNQGEAIVKYIAKLKITTYFYIDTTPPVVKINGTTPSSDEILYTNSNFTVTATDAVGDIHLQHKAPGSTSFYEISSGTTFGNGLGIHEFYALDDAGYESETYSVYYDNLAPLLHLYLIDYDGNSSQYNGGGDECTTTYNFYFKATDKQSGIKELQIKKPGSTSFSTYTSGTIMASEGSYTLKAIDKAGNESTFEVTLKTRYKITIEMSVKNGDEVAGSITPNTHIMYIPIKDFGSSTISVSRIVVDNVFTSFNIEARNSNDSVLSTAPYEVAINTTDYHNTNGTVSWAWSKYKDKYTDYAYGDLQISCSDLSSLIDSNGACTFYIRLQPLIRTYKMDMMYSTATDGVYGTKYFIFSHKSTEDLNYKDNIPASITVGGNEKTFGAWLIGYNGNKILNYKGNETSYTYSYNTYNKSLSFGGWNFVVQDTFTSLTTGNNYFIVTKLSSPSRGSATGNDAFILARWSSTYTVQVENDGGGESNIWNGLSNSTDSTEYYGVGASEGLYLSKTQVNLTIRYGDENNALDYPFMSTEYAGRYLAMYKRDDFSELGAGSLPSSKNSSLSSSGNGSYYYVFKYGFRISGYYIKFLDNNGNTLYLTCDSSGNWGYSPSSKSIDISVLSDGNSMKKMALYAEYLDNLFAGGLHSNTTITMIPIWKAVDVRLNYSGGYIDTTFGETYNTSNIKNSTVGQTLGYLEPNGNASVNEYIMPSTGNIPYTYYKLSHNQYRYYSNNKKYTLIVTPIWIDNVYRINLEGILEKEQNTYALSSNTDYSFANSLADCKSMYSYKDESGYYGYSAGFATDYASEIYSIITGYVDKIANGSYNMLRKVFVNGTIAENNLTVKINDSTNGSSMYMYLANGQVTGRLPIFEKTYKTLIYWVNETDSSKPSYAYTTSDYYAEAHGTPLDSNDKICKVNSEGKWNLSDNYYIYSSTGETTEYTVNFNAHYFRKQYNLDVSIVLGDAIGAYGYAVIVIEDITEDKDKSASYLCLYQNNAMCYYDISGLTITSLKNLNLTNLNMLNGAIKLFAGCKMKISVYDQSKDTDAVMSGKYLSFIGYGYESTNSSLDIFESTDYIHEVSAEEIENENLTTQTSINLIINYKKIKYELGITMSSGDSVEGRFVVTYPDGKVSGALAKTTLNLNVDDMIQINYLAYAGYEFQDVAFSLKVNGQEITLMRYSELNGGQSYILTLDANWLLKNYYKIADNNFTNSDTNLGTVYVNTQKIEYKYYVKVIDGTTSALLEDKYISTWKIGDVVSLENAFTATSMGYVVEVGGKNYAGVCSYAYFPRKPTNKQNYYITYAFLLNDAPIRLYSISSDLLSDMTLSTTYQILPQNLRQIYMVVEVREILTIQFRLAEVEHDPNGARTVTISNGNNNTSSITTKTKTIGSIYTYVGLQNRITLTYNANMYTGATYTYNNLPVQSVFTASESGTLEIRFSPKPVPVRVEYYLNGVQANIEDKLDTNIIYAEELYYCDNITHTDGQISIRFKQKTFDYNLYIYINGENYVGSYNLGEEINLVYYVQKKDCELGEIYIRVEEIEHNNDVVTIELALIDNILSQPNDDYGTYVVKIAGEIADTSPYKVYEGRSLEIELMLNTGYEYYGVMHNNDDLIYPQLEENKLLLTDSFKLSDGGRYRIYLQKTRINAVLSIADGTHKTYTMDTTISIGENITKEINSDNSSIKLNNLYVGKVINLIRTSEDKDEQFNFFYYETNSGIKPIEGDFIEITSALLDEIGNELNLGVSTTPKYKVNVVVEFGEKYLEMDRELYYKDGDYIYYTSGTVLDIDITTKEEGKYTIKVTGDLEQTGDSIHERLILENDIEILIKVTPKSYNVNVKVSVYETIKQLDESNPIEIQSDSVKYEGQLYKDMAKITIERKNNHGELYILEIESESESFKLNVEKGEIVKCASEYPYKEGTLKIGEREYKIQITEENVEIMYETKGDVSLNVEYKNLKVISPNG